MMKICVVSTPIIVCPPPGYSGLEMLAYQQAEGLSKRGHSVLLIAPIGSKPPPGVELHGLTLGESEQQAYSGYAQRLDNWDAIIDNSWQKWSYILKAQGKLKSPVLGVMHAPVNTMYKTPPPVEKACIVCISKDQGMNAEEIWGRKVRVCYNGVDINFYRNRQNRKRNARYLFLSRMSSIKGPDIAVRIARDLKIGLDLVGDDTITGEPWLIEQLKKDCINGISYVGPQSRDQCVGWFCSNRALVHMNLRFREPFGLAPVEAQACGMPVIAFRNGAMTETIINNETGFLVYSEDDVKTLIRANAIENIKSEICIEWASNFSIDRMITRWEELLKEAIESGW